MEKLSENIMRQINQAERDYPDALVTLLSPEGVFIYISPSTEGILGWPREYALGHNIAEYYRSPEVSHIRLTIQDALLCGESIETTRNTPLPTGGVRRMRGAFRKVVDENSGSVYLLSIAKVAEQQ